MSMLNNSLLLGAPASGGYQIQRSLRFNSSDSAYLSRTPASAGNRKTWTWAGWVKRSAFGSFQQLFVAADSNYAQNGFDSSDRLRHYPLNNGSAAITTTAVFRDPSAWYHIVYYTDTTAANASDRLRIYVNGVLQQVTGTYPAQNTDLAFNQAIAHNIGRYWSGSEYLDGYLADVYFIDGQALDPTSFTEVSATTGQLIPKQYTGSFGTNGFWLKFSDNSAATATTLGKDYSGNSNNFTPNNLSVTAGAGNDSLVDTPTSYGTDTGAGGEVRGNYCTLNPLVPAFSGTRTLSNGNLTVSETTAYGTYSATWAISSGTWYWEVTLDSGSTDSMIGIQRINSGPTQAYNAANVGYRASTGTQVINGSYTTSYGASYTIGDVIGVALNADSKSITFYKNGVSQGALSFSSITGDAWVPVCGDDSSATNTTWTFNFGQRPFAYTAPSGFKALCDTNLPAPTIAKPSTVMDVKLYTGNGSTQTISGLGFSPDLVWYKYRAGAAGGSHLWFDQIRTAGQALISNSTAAEQTISNALTAFNSDGFSLGDHSSSNYLNDQYVAWCWDAGSSTVTNTQGSITSTVRANPSAGFSVCTYTGSSSNFTFGHGLNVEPRLILIKNRSASANWFVITKATGSWQYGFLNATDALAPAGQSANSTTVDLANAAYNWFNANGDNFVAYCFAPVAGYSSFGSYVGTGAVSTGPFCYTGFRPRLVILKAAVGGTSGWIMVDTARNTYNAVDYFLQANSSGAESTQVILDAVSNGFVIRPVGDAMNNSGVTFVWAAFAESPFQYARAR